MTTIIRGIEYHVRYVQYSMTLQSVGRVKLGYNQIIIANSADWFSTLVHEILHVIINVGGAGKMREEEICLMAGEAVKIAFLVPPPASTVAEFFETPHQLEEIEAAPSVPFSKRLLSEVDGIEADSRSKP